MILIEAKGSTMVASQIKIKQQENCELLQTANLPHLAFTPTLKPPFPNTMLGFLQPLGQPTTKD